MTRSAPLALAALLLAGCARTLGLEDGVDDGLDFDSRQARLAMIEQWDLTGRLTIETDEDTYRPRFRWRQRGPELSLTVDSRVPLTPSFSVQGNASALTIRTPDETSVLLDPEIELSSRVGWWLPVTSLEHWLLGALDPDYPAERRMLGPLGTLASLRQRDWRIRYDAYRLVEGVLVPTELTFMHQDLRLSLDVGDFSSAASSEP